MNLIARLFRCKRTYENYWRHQLGTTVRVTRGAMEGRCGRLTTLCSDTYGKVFLIEGSEPCFLYADLEVES